MYKSINRQNYHIIDKQNSLKGLVFSPCFMFVAD